MKRKFLTSLVLASLLITGCGNGNTSSNNDTNNSTNTAQGLYTVKVTAVGSTTIKVTQTVTLRAQVVGTNEKDVTWTSANETVATVNDKGIVTGVGAGSVKIRATLKKDTNSYAEITITVEDALTPTSVTIEGFTSAEGWVGESVQLTASIYPEGAANTVNWSTSDSSIASITSGGLLSYLDKGKVKVRAESTVDSTVYDELEIDVRKGIFISSKSSDKWNFANQDAEDAYIDMENTPEGSAGFNAAYFANIESTKFYAEATFQIKGLTSNAWDWQGIGIGNGLSNSDGRFFTYSPHSPTQSANNFNKFILRDLPESWGALTDRTQCWGDRDLDQIQLTDDIKISMLRNGNYYYYLINDSVYYFDETNKYEDIATIPFIVAYDIPVKVFDYRVSTDETEINNLLASEEFNKTFYASNDQVTYKNDSDFTFNNNQKMAKDNRVRSIGDKAKLVRNFEVEFDVDSLAFNFEKACFKGLTVNFQRYDSANILDTIGIGRSGRQEETTDIISNFTQWDWTQTYEDPNNHKSWFETTSSVMPKDDERHHVKIVREINEEEEYAYFKLFIDGVEYPFDMNSQNKEGINARTRYMGAYVLWIGTEYATAHVSNFVLRSNI